MKKKIVICFISCVCFLCAIGITYYSYSKNVGDVFKTASLVVHPDDEEDFMGFNDHAFIGKVVSHLGSGEHIRGVNIDPYNLYEVEVIENIKGELKDKVVVETSCGYDKYGNFHAFEIDGEVGELPEVGEEYIFMTITQESGNLLVDIPQTQIKVENKSGRRKGELINKYRRIYQNEKPYKRERLKTKYAK